MDSKKTFSLKFLFLVAIIAFTQNTSSQHVMKVLKIDGPITSMRSTSPAVIENTNTVYKNNSGSMDFYVYTMKNSNLKVDVCNSVCVDTNNVVWVGTTDGIARIKSNKLTIVDTKAIKFNKSRSYFGVNESIVDKFNNKWFVIDQDVVCKYDDKNWIVYDSSNSPLKNIFSIYADKFGNVWFCDSNGLIKYDGKKWSLMNKSNSKLPDNRIVGVFVDSKKRLWVGTEKGSVMFDGEKVEDFQSTISPLKNTSFEKGFEDKDGNMWFTAYKITPYQGGIVALDTKGIGKYSNTGEWSQLDISNSGIPGNSVTTFIIDEKSSILWCTLDNIGISKFDGKEWEVYTPQNSKVHDTALRKLAIDRDGVLWCPGGPGLLRIKMKR